MQLAELAAKVQSLGLTDKEARVYVAALFLGATSAQKIAEQAGINRATAYVILDQLADLGLIAQSTEGKKTVFVAEGPETLDRLFDRQIEAVEEKRKELQYLLPELQQNQRISVEDAPAVRFYKGQEGIATLANELYRKSLPGSQIYGLMNVDEVEKVITDVFKSSPEHRLKKKISSKVIYSYRKEVPSDAKLLRQTKRISQPIKADISLHEEIASFCTYAGKNSIGVIIESKEIVAALRQLFELAWDNQDPKS